MKKIEYEIKGVSKILFDRHDVDDYRKELIGEEPGGVKQKGIKPWSKKQFYTTENEAFNGKDVPAIPIAYWLMNAMMQSGSGIKQGSKSIKKSIGNDFYILEERIPIGKREHLEKPEYINVSMPTPGQRRGGKRITERPGFNEGWKCKFTIYYEEKAIHANVIKELVEYVGHYIGIGAYRKGMFGRFSIVKSKILN